jgi:anti-sigma B factor antagonist
MFGSEPAIRDDGAHVVVTLRGELDIANAADLGAVLSEAVARNPHVIADLSDLTFIDCAILGILVRARTRAREAGGDLVLAGARGRVRRVLALPCLAGVFLVYAGVNEARERSDLYVSWFRYRLRRRFFLDRVAMVAVCHHGVHQGRSSVCRGTGAGGGVRLCRGGRGEPRAASTGSPHVLHRAFTSGCWAAAWRGPRKPWSGVG